MFSIRENVKIREDIDVKQHEGIFHYLKDADLTKSDKKEITAYQGGEEYRASLNFKDDSHLYFDDLTFKADFTRIFLQLIPRLQLSGSETILEMGGGWCWASALLKMKYPNLYVVGSDLITSNLLRLVKYEKFLNAYIDEKWIFNCRDLPFTANQFDRIFTFAAFHHFGEQNDFSPALKEMIRVLKPKGKIVLLYEPSSPRYLYKLAFKKANPINGVFDEDLLILSKLKHYVSTLKCKFDVEFFPLHSYREGFIETNYYYILTKLSILQKLLPCTVNVTIEKNRDT